MAGLAGIATLIKLVWLRSYDYDELSHAHMVWLVSKGDKPYRDFAMNHFPFFWLALSPLMRFLPEGSGSLIALRCLALFFNGVFMGSLWALVSAGMERSQRVWAAVCLGIVAFSPPANGFLVEFRPDALANALVFGSLLWLWRRAEDAWLAGAAGGFCLGMGMLINTKLLLFPAFLGAVLLLGNLRRLEQVWKFSLAIAGGVGVALAAGVLGLATLRIPLDEAWRMVVSYNATAATNGGLASGLVRALAERPLGLGYIVAGAAVGSWCAFRKREFPKLPLIGVGLFLVADAITTTRPWKQYVSSWFILAAWLPAVIVPQLIVASSKTIQTALALCACLAAVCVFWQSADLDAKGNGVPRGVQDHLVDFACQRVPAEAFVFASFDRIRIGNRV